MKIVHLRGCMELFERLVDIDAEEKLHAPADCTLGCGGLLGRARLIVEVGLNLPACTTTTWLAWKTIHTL